MALGYLGVNDILDAEVRHIYPDDNYSWYKDVKEYLLKRLAESKSEPILDFIKI